MSILEKLFKSKHKIESGSAKNKGESFDQEVGGMEQMPEENIENKQELPEEGGEIDQQVTEVDDENKNENLVEKYTAKVNTVREFIDALKWSYDEAEQKNDHDAARKLGHQIIKIQAGVNISDDSADNIFVRPMSGGVLGLFNNQSKKVDISEAMLSDFKTDKSLIMEVFAHEIRGHKQDGILNEGLNQERVAQITKTSPNIYAGERREVNKTFYKTGMKKAIELHDMDNPEKLIGYYLEVEMEDEVSSTNIKEYASLDKEKRGEKIKKDASDWDKKFSGFLKKGIEELYKKLDGDYIKKKCIELVEKRIDG